MSIGSDRLEQQLELDRICDAFEDEWRRGEAPRLEAYLERAPLPLRTALLNELLPIDVRWRRRLGETIDWDGLLARWPEARLHIEELRAAAAQQPGRMVGSSESTWCADRSTHGSEAGLTATRGWDALEVLRQCRDFEMLPRETLRTIAECAVPRSFSAGEKLIQQGHPGDALMLVEQGVVQVRLIEESGRTCFINRVGPGEILGEMSLLTSEPATADAVALEPTRVLRLPAEAFHAVAARDPRLSVVLTHLVASRLGGRRGDVLSGKTFADFRIVRRLASGGMSVVYEAVRASDHLRVALKMMSHRLVYDRLALQYFQREADLIAAFDHPHIVRLVGRLAAFHTHFIALEFCDGETLAGRLRSGARFPEPEARRILGQLASALAYAHGRGVIHRDIKPSNVMLTSSGNTKLMDFGLARPMEDHERALRHTIIGTPAYMAPELFAGKPASQQSDCFAFGCVAYELLTGRRPTAETEIAQIRRQRLEWTAPDVRATHPQVSDELARVIHDCLEADPARRRLDFDQVAGWAGLSRKP